MIIFLEIAMQCMILEGQKICVHHFTLFIRPPLGPKLGIEVNISMSVCWGAPLPNSTEYSCFSIRDGLGPLAPHSLTHSRMCGVSSTFIGRITYLKRHFGNKHPVKFYCTE